MNGREFLGPANDLLTGPTEAHWRGAVVNAYYALLLECRDALTRWGIMRPPRDNVHAFVRLRFSFARGPDMKRLGQAIDDLVRLRNDASYDLTCAVFATDARSRWAVVRATDALNLLFSIDGDPARRAAAIASI